MRANFFKPKKEERTKLITSEAENSIALEIQGDNKRAASIERFHAIEEKLSSSPTSKSFSTFYPRVGRFKTMRRDCILFLLAIGSTVGAVSLAKHAAKFNEEFRENALKSEDFYYHEPQIELKGLTCKEAFGNPACRKGPMPHAREFHLLSVNSNTKDITPNCSQAADSLCKKDSGDSLWIGVGALSIFATTTFLLPPIWAQRRRLNSPLSRLNDDDVDFLQERHLLSKNDNKIDENEMHHRINVGLVREAVPQELLPSSLENQQGISGIIAEYLEDDPAREVFMKL